MALPSRIPKKGGFPKDPRASAAQPSPWVRSTKSMSWVCQALICRKSKHLQQNPTWNLHQRLCWAHTPVLPLKNKGTAPKIQRTFFPSCFLRERGPGQKKGNLFQALVQTAVKKALKWVPLTDIQGLGEKRRKDPSGKLRVGYQATGESISGDIMLKHSFYYFSALFHDIKVSEVSPSENSKYIFLAFFSLMFLINVFFIFFFFWIKCKSGRCSIF